MHNWGANRGMLLFAIFSVSTNQIISKARWKFVRHQMGEMKNELLNKPTRRLCNNGSPKVLSTIGLKHFIHMTLMDAKNRLNFPRE